VQVGCALVLYCLCYSATNAPTKYYKHFAGLHNVRR
jgi:hypothetical protein